MKATIKSVDGEPRAWGEKWPDACSVVVRFEDGSTGEVNSTFKKDAWRKHYDKLTALVGKEADFTVEDKGEYRGTKQWKITDYEGKAASKDFTPGGGSAWRNSEEGCRFEALARLVNTAIMQGEGDLGKAADILAWGTKQLEGSPVHSGQAKAAVSSSGEKTASRKDSGAAAADEWGAGLVTPGEATPAPCSHLGPLLDALPSGRKVMAGKGYCPDCRAVIPLPQEATT